MEYSFTIGAVALAPEDRAPAVIAAMDAHMHDGVNDDGWQDVTPLEPGRWQFFVGLEYDAFTGRNGFFESGGFDDLTTPDDRSILDGRRLHAHAIEHVEGVHLFTVEYYTLQIEAGDESVCARHVEAQSFKVGDTSDAHALCLSHYLARHGDDWWDLRSPRGVRVVFDVLRDIANPKHQAVFERFSAQFDYVAFRHMLTDIFREYDETSGEADALYFNEDDAETLCQRITCYLAT